MTTAMLCCADEKRSWEIRQALTDTGVDLARQYSSTQVLLSGLAQYGEAETDLLIIDETSSPMPMWDLAAEVSARYPSIAVLAVVNEPTSQDYATALDSGARGVITYPLNFDNVSARVQSAEAWGSSLRKVVQRGAEESAELGGGKMIAVSSAKGGAGSSTVALHLALEAAQSSGRRVVLVDLDLQKPDMSILLDAPRQRDITDLLTVVEELSARFIADVLFDHPKGISVLFGPTEGERGELITEAAAKRILGILRSRFDVVVVDVGSVMGEANATAVEMADDVCIVSHSDVLALRGIRRLVSLWERIGARDPDHVKVVLNGVHKRSDVQPEAARKIVNLPTFRTVLPRLDRPLEQAVNRRDPAAAGPEWAQRIQQLGRELEIVPPETLSRKKEGRRGGRRKSQRAESAEPAQKRQIEQQQENEDGPELSLAGTGSERGAFSIEFVGVFALFMVTAVIVFQLLLMGATWVFASQAANEGARAAAVAGYLPKELAATNAARDRTPGPWRDGLSVNPLGDEITVTLQTPMLVPVTDDFRFPITASAGFVEEP